MIAGDSNTSGEGRLKAALKALKLNPKTGKTVADILLSIACDSNTSGKDAIYAALTALELNPETGQDVVSILLFLACNSNTPGEDRITALFTAFELNPRTKTEVVSTLLSIARHSNTCGDDSIKAALKAFEINPETEKEVISILFSTAEDPSKQYKYNDFAVIKALESMGIESDWLIAKAYLKIACNPIIDFRVRIRAAFNATELYPDAKTEAIWITTHMVEMAAQQPPLTE